MSNSDDIQRDDRVRAWQVRIEGDVFVVISSPLAGDGELAALTAAERDIVCRVLRGDTNQQIADRRGTAVRTVANQLAAIYGKLGIASRAELAARVARRLAR